MAAVERKEIYRGDTPTFTFTLTESDGTPYVLTGYTPYFSAKEDITSSIYTFNKTCTVSNGTGGICETTLTTTDTATAGHYTAELSLISGATVITATQFELIINRDVRT